MRCVRPLLQLLLSGLLLAPLAGRAQDERAEVARLQTVGQTATALERAEAYLATHPKDAPMRFLKGVLLAELQRSSEAIDAYERLSEDFPELAEPYNNAAVLHAAAGDYERARLALEQALRANPSFALAHQNLGDVLAALAGRSYARALQLDAGNALLASKLATLRQWLGPPSPAR